MTTETATSKADRNVEDITDAARAARAAVYAARAAARMAQADQLRVLIPNPFVGNEVRK